MGKLKNKIDKLEFGDILTININPSELEEQNGKKGDAGYLMEPFVVKKLFDLLRSKNLNVITSEEEINTLIKDTLKNAPNKLTQEEIDNTWEKAQATAQKIFEDLLNSEDVFLLNFDIKKGRGDKAKSSADLRVIITKPTKSEIVKEILVSLKNYASSNSSQGSKSFVTRISSLFYDLEKNLTEKNWDKLLSLEPSPKVKSSLTKLRELIRIAKLPNSKESKNNPLFKEFTQSKFYDPKILTSSNPSRNTSWQNFLNTKFGGDFRSQLSDSFKEVWNALMDSRLNDEEFKEKLIKEIKFLIGFDDVYIINAISTNEGIKVLNYNLSPGYQKILSKIQNLTKVYLEKEPNKSSFKVVLYTGETPILKFRVGMNYYDGTVQVQVSHDKIEKGELN